MMVVVEVNVRVVVKVMTMKSYGVRQYMHCLHPTCIPDDAWVRRYRRRQTP